MSSPAQVLANQANSQLSTGAKTAEGKVIASRNALKTGLTGHTVLLPTDDAELYETQLLRHLDALAPVGDAETALVQSLADTEWRLARIPSLEFGIFALARIEFADRFNDQPADLRPSLIQAYTYLAYQRQLNNLSIQESRLNRQLLKIVKDLAALQSLCVKTSAPNPAREQGDEDSQPLAHGQRKQLEMEQLNEAARLYLAAKKANKPFHPEEFGFVFSIDQIRSLAELIQDREQSVGAAA